MFWPQTYATGIGEQRSIVLADGSTVDLNSRSKIRIRFSSERRGVELIEGQALFKVAKDHARPFVVDSDGTRVRAVGTQFDVYRKRRGHHRYRRRRTRGRARRTGRRRRCDVSLNRKPPRSGRACWCPPANK